MQEHIYQREPEALVARAIPIFFLFFLLFRSFGLHAEMFQTGAFKTEQGIPQIPYYQRSCAQPITIIAAIDSSKPFEEVFVWLAQDANGAPIICTRKTSRSPYDQEPDEYCSPAMLAPIEKVPEKVPDGSICWESNEYLLCMKPNKEVQLFTKK